ncbi:winged helix-turn-helix domain-containing protein [Luteimonas aquatica]|uniref:winged helix-turn-helix domain-containing protein n=1 Tax=Luteimonas aquatica TaxID=450364 RepID=UPI001F5970DA|nr:winged helix-turn-helix domain-containing protein [Luteimonas aquatica]
MTILRYRFGDHSLDLGKRELRRAEVPVLLPARVFECLCFLIEHRDRAVSRDELVQAVFGRADVSDAQLAQIVVRARRAVGDDGHEQRSIRTVPRYGFRWMEETSVETDAEPARVVPAAVPAPTSTSASVPTFAQADGARVAPAPPSPARARHRWRWLAIAALLLVLAAWGIARLDSSRTQPAPAAALPPAGRALMVLPSEIEDRENASWARLGLMDFVGDRLHRAGLRVLPSEAVLGVLREHGADDPQLLRRASRADWIVSSRAERLSDGWRVTLVASDAGGMEQRGQARHADLLEAARLAADRLQAALGGRLPAGETGQPGLAERLQRARAAMLANEIETARRILAEAPELQRAQPLLRYQLARVDFRAGEYARGLETLDGLLASEEVRRDPVFRMRVLNARGAMLIRLERYDAAERDYDAVVALAGDGGRHPAELGQALSGRAVVHSTLRRFDRALADYGNARVQMAAAGDALAVARVDANLGILEIDRERPAQALPYLRKAVEDFRSMGAVNELATLRRMLIAAHLQLLRPDAALAESERAWAMLERVRDPMQRADLILVRAEALIAAGGLREAARLLEMPEAAHLAAADHGRLDYLRVELALRGGALRQAVALADRSLRDWPRQQNPRLRGWMRLRRQQAAQEADLDTAPGAVASQDASLPGRLLGALEQAAVEPRAPGDTAAEDGYRAALALAEQRGIPQEIAAVVEPYALWLLRRDRRDEAAALIGRVAPWAEYDFDMALLQLRLARGDGQRGQWRTAFAHAAALAGERRIPAELDPDAAARAENRDRSQ